MKATSFDTDEIEMEKAKERVDKILGTPPVTNGFEIHGVEAPKPPRKPRSDKGVPKIAKTSVVRNGILTVEQAAHIDKLVGAMSEANIASKNAAQEAYRACAAYYTYLDELQGKTHDPR